MALSGSGEGLFSTMAWKKQKYVFLIDSNLNKTWYYLAMQRIFYIPHKEKQRDFIFKMSAAKFIASRPRIILCPARIGLRCETFAHRILSDRENMHILKEDINH